MKKYFQMAALAYGITLWIATIAATPLLAMVIILLPVVQVTVGQVVTWAGVAFVVVWLHFFVFFLLDDLDEEETGPENERGRSWFGNDGIDCSIGAAREAA